MRYTAKFGHLEKLPDLTVNQIIKSGYKIGTMGNTGHSFGAHLHLDLIEGFHCDIWRLSDIYISREHATQSAYFIDNELFNSDIEITTSYCDPTYFDSSGKLILHPGYDVIPKNRDPDNFDIFWNRSMPGQVLYSGKDFDDITKGYGYCILIGFDA